MLNLNKNKIYAKAVGYYIKISTNKISRVLNQIRGKSYEEARMLLEFMPYKACKIILSILESAAANAENNLNMNKNNLIIINAFSNKGPVLKRSKPRAKGQSFKILKPTSHIVIVIQEII